MAITYGLTSLTKSTLAAGLFNSATKIRAVVDYSGSGVPTLTDQYAENTISFDMTINSTPDQNTDAIAQLNKIYGDSGNPILIVLPSGYNTATVKRLEFTNDTGNENTNTVYFTWTFQTGDIDIYTGNGELHIEDILFSVNAA